MLTSPRTSVNISKPKIENCDDKPNGKDYKSNKPNEIIDNNCQTEELDTQVINKVCYCILIKLIS